MTVEEERRGDGRAKVPIVRHPNSDKHAAACHSALLIGRSHLMIDQIQAQSPTPLLVSSLGLSQRLTNFPPSPQKDLRVHLDMAQVTEIYNHYSCRGSSYQYAAGFEHACCKHDFSKHNTGQDGSRLVRHAVWSVTHHQSTRENELPACQLLRARTLAIQDSAHRRHSYSRKSFEFERLRLDKLPQNWSAVVALLYFF